MTELLQSFLRRQVSLPVSTGDCQVNYKYNMEFAFHKFPPPEKRMSA